MAAAEDQPERRAPVLAFVDNRPLEVDFDRLLNGAGITVAIRNNSGAERHVGVRLAGLVSLNGERDEKLEHFLRVDQQKNPLGDVTNGHDVDAHAISSFDLVPDAKEANRPKKGSYPGVIVATAGRDVVRRDFTLHVKEPPKPPNANPSGTTPKPPKPSLQAKTIDDFSVQGTNYVPSLLSPLPAALFGFGILLLIVAAIFGLGRFAQREYARDVCILLGALCIGAWAILVFGRHGAHFSGWSLGVAIAGIVIVVIVSVIDLVWRLSHQSPARRSLLRLILEVGLALFGAALLLGGMVTMLGRASYTDAPSPRFIKTQTPRVAQVPRRQDELPVVVGGLAAPDGTVANAEIQNGRFKVKGLERAGEYKGKIDFLPGEKNKDIGEATATANVRDFWPYALIVIALGVLIGYLVVGYFTRERPLAKARLRMESLRVRVNQAEKMLDTHFAKDPLTGIAISQRVEARLKDIERVLADEGLTEGTKEIDTLETYVDAFETLSARALRLQALICELEALIKDLSLGEDRLGAAALVRARQDLADRLDSSEFLDRDSQQLNQRTKQIDAHIALLEAMSGALQLLKEPITAQPPLDWDEPRRNALEEQQLILRQSANAIVGAGSPDEVDKAYEADATYAAREAIRAMLPSKDPEAVGTALGIMFMHEISPSAFYPITGVRKKEAPPHVDLQGELHCYVTGSTSSECTGYVSDRFFFTADLTLPRDATAERVHWEYGDGKRSGSIPFATPLPLVPHSYDKSGEFEAKLVQETQPPRIIGTLSVSVSPGSRADEIRDRIRARDRQMTYVSGSLALGSGLLSLYFTGSTWGSPDDYLKALLWGSVFSEGLKYATSMVSHVIWTGRVA